MHVQLDAAGSNSLLSIMRQVTALVRRRGKFETCGEHHAPVAQRQEASGLEPEQCQFESDPGSQRKALETGLFVFSRTKTQRASCTRFRPSSTALSMRLRTSASRSRRTGARAVKHPSATAGSFPERNLRLPRNAGSATGRNTTVDPCGYRSVLSGDRAKPE